MVVRGREYLLVHSYSRSFEPPFKEEGGQGEPKKTYAIKLTSLLLPISWSGEKTVKDAHFSVAFPS